MELACLDLEGVLVPEIWIAFAERTGIEELKATTRDIPDYNVLMRQRLERAIAELDVVSREEVEAVKAMAQKAREENDELREKIDALEKKLGG